MNIAALTGHRVTSFTVRLLDSKMGEKKVLRGVRSGEVTLSAATRLRASGSLELVDLDDDVDFLSDRVRIECTVNGETWPVGTFIMSAPERKYSDSGSAWKVDLLSVLAVIDSAATLKYTTGKYAFVEPAFFLASTGLALSQAVLPANRVPSSLVWPPGTSYLKMMNEALRSVGFFALNPSGLGELEVKPYIRPSLRPVVWEFVEGDESVHSASWSRHQDSAAVPNKVILVGQGSAESKALVGVAVNENPESLYSVVSRGREIVHTETGVEAADQEALDLLARKKLIELSTPQATLSVEFAPLPLRPGEVIWWESHGHRTKATIHEIKYSLSPTGLCKATLKEVVDV